MRNRILTAVVVLACAGLVACSAVATLGTDPNTALNQLTAIHKSRDAALAGKDAAALSKQHAPDLVVTLADGSKLDRAGFETLLQEKAEVVAPSRITKLTQEEGVYVAVVTPGLQGQGSALRETWKRTGAGWVLKRVEEVTAPSSIARKS